MPKGGLEPPCPFEHNALNVACLPISPFRLVAIVFGDRHILLNLLRLVKRFLASSGRSAEELKKNLPAVRYARHKSSIWYNYIDILK
jgi:hypothetical protein